MTEKEKMLAGEIYDCGDPELLELWYLGKNLARDYNLADANNIEDKKKILKQLLGGFGENLWITAPFYVDYGCHIYLGDNCEINMNCTFVDNKTIRIGDRVLIASNVQIYTSSHPVLPQERFVPDWRERQTTFFRTYARPIEIESNVWIGGGCILLPGVTIGKNSVIGAGSVVTRPIPPNCVAVGNPCRVIRYFDTDRERWQHEV